MGTNENVKNINANIQDIENKENMSSIVKNTNDNQQEKQFNSNAQENINQIKANEPNSQNIDNSNKNNFNMQETQRIDFLSDFLKGSENVNKEFFEEINEENVEQKNQNIIRSENEKNVNANSEIKVIHDSENGKEKLLVDKQMNEKQTKQTVQSKCVQQDECFDEVKTKQPEKIENKEKQHTQDKKDFRLERMLFDRINKMQGKIKESLELIKKFERINAKEENLPNIVTTLHDKLTQEVIKQFRTVGIEFNMKSYLVQAIVSDLLNKFEEGITEFKDCSENLNFVREVQEDFESRVELAPTSKVKNIFARLRGLFKPERKQERLEQLERERQEKKLEEANIHLIKYKFINNELERYTIRKNIINSLTREILYGQGSGLTLNIKEFINTKVIPEMKMLGLDSLLPGLEENLYKEYKEKFNGVQKEEFLNLSVGEVKKNIKFSRSGYVRSKISMVTNSKVEEEEDRMVV